MTLPPFQTLLDDHAAAVAAYLRGMLGAADAEDAVQDTYLAAFRAYPGFDGAHPRAWLMTIARRKAIDVARSRARRPEPLAEPDELPAGWRSYPPAPALADLGRTWLVARTSAVLLVPSAVVPNEWNAVLDPTHPDFARIAIGEPADFPVDRRLTREA